MAKRKRTGKPLDWPTFHKMFSTEHKCYVFWESILWKNGPVCHRCNRGDKAYKSAKKPHHYKCGYCKRWFSVRAITPMHRSDRPMRDWIFGIYAMVTSRTGISVMQFSKEIGVGYTTAWHLLHRLRFSCALPVRKLRGIVEADKHYSGGKQKNMHASKRTKNARGGKTMARIAGLRERETGEVRFLYTPDRSDASLIQHIYDNVEIGAVMSTERAYKKIKKDFPHLTICHSRGVYADGDATVNSMESAWSVVVNTIGGTHYHVSLKDLPLYLREIAFRLNQGNCEVDTIDRMIALARGWPAGGCPLRLWPGGRETMRSGFAVRQRREERLSGGGMSQTAMENSASKLSDPVATDSVKYVPRDYIPCRTPC